MTERFGLEPFYLPRIIVRLIGLYSQPTAEVGRLHDPGGVH
jgi:hypothetical protein